MTDFIRGLGAIPSPPDERDYQLSIPNEVGLASRWTLTNLGPVLESTELFAFVAGMTT